MSDDPNAAGNPSGGDDTVIDKRTALAGGSLPGDGGAPPPDVGGDGGEQPTWREDWREALAGDDQVLLRQLKRFARPENLAKSYHEIFKLSKSGQPVPALPEDATEEEIAAYRKSIGVPEKPEDYGFAFPEQAGATEADAAVLGEFSKFLHDRHISKNDPGAKAAFEFYLNRLNEGRAARAEAEQDAEIQAKAELHAAFPPNELKRNNRIADEFLMRHFGESQESLDAINMVLDTRLPNGVKVMHHAPFMKALFSMALAYADDEALVAGDRAGGGGKSLEDRIKELRSKSVDGTISKLEDAELNKLYEERITREARQGRRAA